MLHDHRRPICGGLGTLVVEPPPDNAAGGVSPLNIFSNQAVKAGICFFEKSKKLTDTSSKLFLFIYNVLCVLAGFGLLLYT